MKHLVADDKSSLGGRFAAVRMFFDFLRHFLASNAASVSGDESCNISAGTKGFGVSTWSSHSHESKVKHIK